MGIYFDYTASGLLDPEVLDLYVEALKKFNYNPASLHHDGRQCRLAIEEARCRMAAVLDCEAEEIIFTSGGSESINTALKSVTIESRRRGRKLVSDAAEHPATMETLRFLETAEKREVDFLPLKNGRYDLSALRASLEGSAADLISSLYVHNENGMIYPLAEIKALRDELSPSAKWHVDAVQALGKLPISFKNIGADFMSFSLHKIGAPKGIGLLLARRNLRLCPLIHGGGQQGGRRSGTENPPLILASALAMEKSAKTVEQNWTRVSALKTLLLERLRASSQPFREVSDARSVPHIVLLLFPGLRAQTLQNGLSERGFDLSIGSACASTKDADPALIALGLSADESRHAVRISLSAQTREEDIERLVHEIADLLTRFGGAEH